MCAALAAITVLLAATAASGMVASPASRCTITGTARPDIVRGTPGADVICGLGGGDRIFGEGGNDTIRGEAGPDRLHGGRGHDKLFGGSGSDVYFLGAHPAEDQLFLGEGDRCVGPHAGGRSSVRACRRLGSIDPGFGDIVTQPRGPVLADHDPPELDNLSLTRESVDTSTGATIQVSLRASDSSEIASIRMEIRSPGDGLWKEVDFGGGPPESVTSIRDFDVPSTTAAGTYRIGRIRLEDVAGNVSIVETTELRAMELPIGFTVYEGPDLTAPRLVSFSPSPSIADTSKGAVRINLTVAANDAASGVRAVWVELVPPEWQEGDGEGLYVELGVLAAGDSSNGVWKGSFDLPAHSSPGDYRVRQVVLYDNEGNPGDYDTAALQALKSQTAVTQTGAGDTMPPEIADVAIQTPVLHAEAGDNVLIVDTRVKDDLSGAGVLGEGFAKLGITFKGVGIPFPGAGWGPPVLRSGTRTDGVWRHEIALGQAAGFGEYRIDSVEAADLAGNRAYLSGAALEAEGWDLTFENLP